MSRIITLVQAYISEIRNNNKCFLIIMMINILYSTMNITIPENQKEIRRLGLYQRNWVLVGFEVLTAVFTKGSVLWDIT
jgi:hypothetical protein